MYFLHSPATKTIVMGLKGSDIGLIMGSGNINIGNTNI